MIVTVNSEVFAQELRTVEKIVSGKTLIPVLQNVLLRANEHLHFSTTDNEVSISTRCAANVQAPGAVTLPVKTLLDMISQLPDAEVYLAMDERGQVRIASGNFKSRLQALPAETFPVLPAINGEIVSLSGNVLRILAHKVRFAINEKTTRFSINGALLSLTGNVIAMVATDGKRLALATAVRSEEGASISAIIPTKTLDVLLSQEVLGADMKFALGERHLFFDFENGLLSSRMLEEKFPAYQRIIPRDNAQVLTIGRASFLAALKRVSLVSADTRTTTFAIEKDALTIGASSAELGDALEHLPIKYEGPNLKIAIDWSYVIDFLNASSGQFITMALKDGGPSALFSDGADYINVILLQRT